VNTRNQYTESTSGDPITHLLAKCEMSVRLRRRCVQRQSRRGGMDARINSFNMK
jgi:hypothetical protein